MDLGTAMGMWKKTIGILISSSGCLAGLMGAGEAIELPKNVASSMSADKGVHHVDTLNIHDPAVLVDPVSRRYYVYDSYQSGSGVDRLVSKTGRSGVEACWSEDLEIWNGPELVYEIEEDSWAQPRQAPWAPEVHYYHGHYYLFLTFHDPDTELKQIEGRPRLFKRSSQILKGDSPLGPFKRFFNQPHTPLEEMALDGTLWVEDGQAWMVYCQEWIQAGDGLIKAIRLSDDLSASEGDPITLINAGDVEWTAKTSNHPGYTTRAVVTDGPWLYRSKSGTLMLLWSSWNKDAAEAYTTSLAYSESEKLEGPWRHREKPLLSGDRGHGNLFHTFEGELMLSVHRYFHQPHTRLQIWEVEDIGEDLRVVKQRFGHP